MNSNSIDNDRFLSTVEIFDMLRPGSSLKHLNIKAEVDRLKLLSSFFFLETIVSSTNYVETVCAKGKRANLL